MSTSTLPVLKISPAALARALLRSGRVTDPALAQRVAEKLALRLSSRTTEAPATALSASDEELAQQIAKKRGITIDEARQQFADTPPMTAVRPTARAVAKVLQARGVPLALSQERAAKIVAVEDGKRALADRPDAPAAPAEPTLTLTTRELALKIHRATGLPLEACGLAAEAQARQQQRGGRGQPAGGRAPRPRAPNAPRASHFARRPRRGLA